MTARQSGVIRLTQKQMGQAQDEIMGTLEAISEQQITLILQALPADRFSEVASDFVKKILLINKERLLSL